ncbi:MAG: tetratricopeptide repeat protein, partial [Candidatus Brocadiales bacterium]
MRRITFIITHLLLPSLLITIFSCASVHDSAISGFNKAIEINPKDAEAYIGRGNVYA